MIVTQAESEQPLASVISTQYVVVDAGLAVGFAQLRQLSPSGGDQAYTIPPVAVSAVLVPIVMLVLPVIAAVAAAKLVIVTTVVAVQPFASVAVQVYVPSARLAATGLLPPEGVQAYVKIPVPPVAAAEAPPLPVPQPGDVVEVTAMAAGSVIVTICVPVHPFASVIVHVYDPVPRLEAVAAVPPEGVQLYVYGPVPPEGVMVDEPLLPPLQLILVVAAAPATAAGAVMVNDCVVVQLFASVIVQVYDPAERPDAVAAVPPLGVQLYVYGPVPPEAVTVALPLLLLEQVRSTCEELATDGPPLLATTTVAVSEQLLPSVITQEYVPDARLVAVAAVPPEGSQL